VLQLRYKVVCFVEEVVPPPDLEYAVEKRTRNMPGVRERSLPLEGTALEAGRDIPAR
jgi:hypothetical protein